MTLVLTLLALLLSVAPAAAHTFTFPITLTDYWPNIEAMDAKWKLEGTSNFTWWFRRTGPATFALVGGQGCIEDHYLVTFEDSIHGQPIPSDPRVDGGTYLTHSWADCPQSQGGFLFRQHYAPFQRFMPLMWDPGFGSVSAEQTNYKFFIGHDRRSGAVQDEWRTEMNAWTDPTLTPDGIHHNFLQKGFGLHDGSDKGGPTYEEFWFGDVPICGAPSQTAKGLTRYRGRDVSSGVIAVDVTFCWRKP